MKLKEFKEYGNTEFTEINEVRNKEVLRIVVKKPLYINYVKDVIRSIMISNGVGIRKRIDIGEDNWLGKEFVYGETLVVVRTLESLNSKLIEELNYKLNEKGLLEEIEILAHESNKVSDFRNIIEKYDRVIYRLLLDVKEELIYDLSESNGGWKQKVLQWNGDIEEERVDGIVRVSNVKVGNTESNIYSILIDVPYGLDVYRMVEQEFGLKKGSLEGYPIESFKVYQSVEEGKNHLGRKKCQIFNTSIERTVGGLVGNTSIRAILADKKATVVKGRIK